MITPDVVVIGCVMSLWFPRRGVGYLLPWLDRSFWMIRRFAGRQLGVVQKPATHRVS